MFYDFLFKKQLSMSPQQQAKIDKRKSIIIMGYQCHPDNWGDIDNNLGTKKYIRTTYIYKLQTVFDSQDIIWYIHIFTSTITAREWKYPQKPQKPIKVTPVDVPYFITGLTRAVDYMICSFTF